MGRDIFTNKWVLGSMFGLLIFAGACYWYYQHTTAHYKAEAEQDDRLLQKWKANKAKQTTTADKEVTNTPADNITKPQRNKIGEETETNTDKQKADKFPDWHSLTPEQKQHIADQFYVQYGLKPPPHGYDYDWKEPGVPYLDENGNPVLRRLDEPVVRIRMGIGFAPTKEEFEKHNQLKNDRWRAKKRDDVAEVARLDAEIAALKAAAQRMRPLNVMSISTNAEAGSKASRFRKEKFNAALREHGLEHLISPWKKNY